MNPEIITEDKAALETKFDVIGNLPREICFKILSYLEPKDIANAFGCCKKWQQHVDHNFVWREIYRRDYTEDSEEEPKSETYQKFVQSYSAYWHGRYAYQRTLKYNVEKQKFGRTQIEVYKKTVFRFIYMDDRMIILSTILDLVIINSSTGSVEQIIWFKNLDNFQAIKHGDHLIALTGEGNWKVWNVKDWTVVKDAYISEIATSDCRIKLLVACKHLILIVTTDCQVYIVNLIRQNYFYGGPGTYACSNNDLIAILDNGNIDLRDTDFNCVASFKCADLDIVINMQMNEDFLVTEQYKNLQYCRLLSIFNIKTKTIHKFDMYIGFDPPSAFQISQNRLVFRIHGGMVEVWDMSTQKYLFYILAESEKLILHGSYIHVNLKDAGWQIFCLQAGNLVHNLGLSEDIVAITNTRVLRKWDHDGDHFWDILDYEANL